MKTTGVRSLPLASATCCSSWGSSVVAAMSVTLRGAASVVTSAAPRYRFRCDGRRRISASADARERPQAPARLDRRAAHRAARLARRPVAQPARLARADALVPRGPRARRGARAGLRAARRPAARGPRVAPYVADARVDARRGREPRVARRPVADRALPRPAPPPRAPAAHAAAATIPRGADVCAAALRGPAVVLVVV